MLSLSFSSVRFSVLFLLLAIMYQSMAVVVSTLDIHQYDPEHAQTEHSHTVDTSSISIDITSHITDDDEHNTDDCHHCGHCSGMHLHWVNGKVLVQNSTLLTFNRFEHLAELPVSVIQEFLRPPIS